MASRFRDLDPRLQPWAQYLYDVAIYNGRRPVVTSTYRSPQKQAVLYERWRAGKSAIPAAPPGRSLHNYGLAFDMVIDNDWRGPWQRALGEYWRSLGGRWYERDPVHFEYPT